MNKNKFAKKTVDNYFKTFVAKIAALKVSKLPKNYNLYFLIA